MPDPEPVTGAALPGSSLPESSLPGSSQRSTAAGPGRVLIAVYGVFALAATSRAAVQIATSWSQAPLAYTLSAFSAVVYVLATVALARGGRPDGERAGQRWRRIATAAVTTELIGVLVVGAFSVLRPADFPRATVWSGFGAGYLFIPLVLPVVGLRWLRRTGRR